MNSKEFRNSLVNGDRIYGTLLVSPSPHWLEGVRLIGLDFVFIDTEHIALNEDKLMWMLQAYKALGTPPIVRIPSPDPYLACKTIDMGAAGVIAPYVETVEEVKNLVGAVKYRPLKGKRLRNLLNGKEILEPALEEYLENHNGGKSLIVNIESVPALESLDEILSVEELDGVLIGPHDLTCSMGIPEQYNHPDFISTVDTIIMKARSVGKGAGIHMVYNKNRMKHEIRWAKMGANLIIHSVDWVCFRENIGDDIQLLRKELGDFDREIDGVINI